MMLSEVVIAVGCVEMFALIVALAAMTWARKRPIHIDPGPRATGEVKSDERVAA